MALPLLDEHSTSIGAAPPVVWRAVRRYAGALTRTDHAVLGRLLGAEPRSGFDVAEEVEPARVVLAGRHRFARYRLVFELDEGSGTTTRLTIRSLAAFPGARGRVYRTLLIGTGGHVLAVRHMLRRIRRDVG